MLGGTDNYAADRIAADQVEDLLPGTKAMARNNRRFMERVVRYLAADCGIRQFIDNGSGLPTQNNVHQIAQRIAPGSRAIYVDEGVLRRPVGGYDVMRKQLEYLMRPRDRANVTVQVLPFDAGVHPSMVGPFTAMTFPDPGDLGVVNVENATSTLFLEEPDELRIYEELWNTLQASALSADDSQAFLKSTSFGYRLKEGMK